jgi:hypothetical protein
MSFDLFTNFATDEVAENAGTWRDISPTASLLIARSGNRAYARMLSAEVEKNRLLLDAKGDAADAKSDDILVAVVAETILLDWKGITYKGADLPYSKANAQLVLRLKDFRALVQKLADETSSYKLKLEVEQGNS